MIKILNAFFLILFIQISISAQAITWQPVYATDGDSLVVYFDATEGNAGLEGFTGEVYAHTGVITTESVAPNDWKYVKTPWGLNTSETKLQRVGADYYKFVISPSIREFYRVPDNEEILEVAFVFRSALASNNGGYFEGKTSEGEDIFLPLRYGFSILQPKEIPLFLKSGESFELAVEKVSIVDTLKLFINGRCDLETVNDTLRYSITAETPGKHWVKLIGVIDSNLNAVDSFYYFVHPEQVVEELPAGIKPGINYLDLNTVTLNLYAPNKDFVYLIGDFNDWKVDENYMMKITPDSNNYWISLKYLTPMQEYGFQYYVDGEIRIPDPYAEKILDPWNDKWISDETYPDLKPYPNLKTNNIVSVFQTGQEDYDWKVEDFNRPKKTDLVIYEMLLRDFLEEHDYEALIDTLGYLKNLGVNAIELMPVMEFEGNESWGYNPMMYFAPDKYYGTPEQLKRFIDAAHQDSIAVIFDLVLNHAYGLNPLVRLYFNNSLNRPSAENPWFNQVSPNPVFSWGYDFNHESEATKKFVDSVTTFWIEEYNIDGYRFDFTKGFTNTPGDGGAKDPARIAILKRMADHIWSVDSSFYVILEHFADNLEEKELSSYGMMIWGNMNYNYSEAAMGYNESGKSNLTGVSYKSRGWTDPHLVSYMESHDEERLMFKNLQYGNSSGAYDITDTSTALNRIKLAAAFFFTVPGPKMIWQFGELGYDYSIDFNGRVGNKPIRWDYLDQQKRNNLYKVFSALINLKTEYDVFETRDFKINLSGALKTIHLNDPTMNIAVIGNFDVVNREINPAFQSAGTWYDFFSGDSIFVTDPTKNILLKPGEFHIYSTEKLPTPEADIVTGVEDNREEVVINSFELRQNYPNPFNPATVIEYNLPEISRVSLTVYDALGREVILLVDEEQPRGVYKKIWNGVNNSGVQVSSGVYFYRLETGSFVKTKKMILLR